MNIKDIIHNYFAEEHATHQEKKHLDMLEKAIVKTMLHAQGGQNTTPSFGAILYRLKYFLVPVVSVAVIVLVLLSTSYAQFVKTVREHGLAHLLIKNVSAEELVNLVQAKLASNRLHYKLETQSMAPDVFGNAPATPQSYTREVWIDKQAKMTRGQTYDKDGLVNFQIGHALLPKMEGNTYTFVFDKQTKEGIFTTDYRTVEPSLAISEDDLDILTLVRKKQLGNLTTVAETVHNNKPAYKLTLYDAHTREEANDKQMPVTENQRKACQKVIDAKQDAAQVKQICGSPTASFLISTETLLPEEETIYNATHQIQEQKKFTYMTQAFENTVFDLIPPPGYTVIKQPKTTSFALVVTGGTRSHAKTAHPGPMRNILALVTTVTNGKSSITTWGGLPSEYTYSLFVSEQGYPSLLEAKQAQHVSFVEVHRSVEEGERWTNPNANWFMLPDSSPKEYGIFKLQIKDTQGNKIDELVRIAPFAPLVADQENAPRNTNAFDYFTQN